MNRLTPTILKEILYKFFDEVLGISHDKVEEWFEKNAEKAEGLQAGTHVAKGIHSSSKGSNIIFKANSNWHDDVLGLIGTHTLNDLALDVSGNGALITLMRVVAMPVQEGFLYDLLLADHPALEGLFSKDKKRSAEMQKALKSVYIEQEELISDELLKQVIWPLENAESIESDRYRNLIPLHASSFLYEANLRVRARYSDEIKEAKKLRQDWHKVDFHKKEEKENKREVLNPYFNFQDLARIKLGGAHPRNVGLHTHNLFGRNHLLPSFPPNTNLGESHFIYQDVDTIFDRRLAYRCDSGFVELTMALKRIPHHDKINIDIQEHFRIALDEIFYNILNLMAEYQAKPAGWSDEYQLHSAEKNWLDPQRIKNAGKSLSREEIELLATKIKNWVVETLQQRKELGAILEGKSQGEVFADREYDKWLKMLKVTLFGSLSDDVINSEELPEVNHVQ